MTKFLFRGIGSFIIASGTGMMMGIWDGRTWLAGTIMIFALFSLTFNGSNKTKRM